MNKSNFAILSICLLLLSCGHTVKLSSGKFSKTDKYKINSYAGCCGCAAEYFNIYNGTQVNIQIVYKYNCYSAGMPTKFIFNYDEYGSLLYCDKLVATTADDFTIPLTSNERDLFLLLDKSKVLKIGDKFLKYTAIKGFRKANAGEVTHPFPLCRGGVKIKLK